ncbi:NB-ARC domain-containing protein [Nostoc sp. UHCC 0251]|uniref:NB-ARC domain-containing protein n=1 Tax=Nostoc sp. UHCC 0251 TaxID=3110240 RepID=UPI002B213775|nr:NB-ARC domain-containing protein [Nostoc sp. UHCC 0251]MEA5624554.1 NB-ARC domain-containing protein [Nostoc sp. UHCC 0251]
MDFDDLRELKVSVPSFLSIITTEEEPPEQRFSETMTFEEALVAVNDLVFAKLGRHLSEAEIIVMKGAWNSREFVEIAENSPYSVNYLQRRLAPQLWDLLSQIIGDGQRVGKRKLRYFLEQVAKKYPAQSASNQGQVTLDTGFMQKIKGQPPNVSTFYGRIQELAHLKELIVKQRCVSLVGVAGIGKSALAAKLLAELSIKSKPRFDCLIWKSVTHAPRVQDLVADLIELIDPLEPSSNLPEYTQAMISVLVKQLQSRNCLLVLDEADALFHRNKLEQRLEYKVLFRRLLEEQHQSCLLLTNRIFPEEFGTLMKAKRPIEYLKIEGLDSEAAMQLLSANGLTDKDKCQKLIHTYRGNPLELETLVEKIHHYFASSTENFFRKYTTFVSSEFQAMLDEMFGEILSETQRWIMIYLAEKINLNLKPVSFEQLLSDTSQSQETPVSTSEVIKALEQLERQSLIESSKDPVTKEISFTLQPMIKKYITADPMGLVHTSDTLPALAIAS